MRSAVRMALGAALLTALPLTTTAQELSWSPCADPTPHADAECASVAVPLDYGDPDAGTMEITVARIVDAAAPAGPRSILWYLPGGPGDSGVEPLGRLHDIFGNSGIDIYSLDHRGVGGSAVLRCPDQEAEDSEEGREISTDEWPACIEWLRDNRTDLDYLTVTAAAQDVGRVIDLATTPEDQVVVFGASYGTYWANRYLTLYPDQPDGVILDGLVTADWTFAEFDSALDQVGRALLERCVRSAECADHLGPDPVTLAVELPGRFDEGHCPELSNQIDGDTLRLVFGNMLMAGPEVWPYIPALMFRVNRCKVRDLEAAGALFETLFESGEIGEVESHSPALQRHVAMSELWPADAPTTEQLERAVTRTTMTTGVSASFSRTYEDWPRYPAPASANAMADYAGPMLLLHGGMDPTMPVDRLESLIEHFSGPGQEFVLFPDSGHVTLNGNDCAVSLYRAFLAEPGAPLDRGCVESAPTVMLTAPETDESLFGTDDFWGESATTTEWLVMALNVMIAVAMAGIAFWLARWLRRRREQRAA